MPESHSRISRTKDSSQHTSKPDAKPDTPIADEQAGWLHLQRVVGNWRLQRLIQKLPVDTARPKSLPPFMSILRGIQRQGEGAGFERSEVDPIPVLPSKHPKLLEIEQLIALLTENQQKAEAPASTTDTSPKSNWDKGVIQHLDNSAEYKRYKESNTDQVQAALLLLTQVRDKIGSLDANELNMDAASLATLKGKYYRQVNSLTPYYTQMANRNILPKGGEAWTRTCNMTSTSMVLNGLGLGAANFESGERDTLVQIATSLDETLKDWAAVSALRMPDFLQLVMITIEYKKLAGDNFGERVTQARASAAGRISTTLDVFKEISALFGAEVSQIGGIETYASHESAWLGQTVQGVDTNYQNREKVLKNKQKQELNRLEKQHKKALDDLKKQIKKDKTPKEAADELTEAKTTEQEAEIEKLTDQHQKALDDLNAEKTTERAAVDARQQLFKQEKDLKASHKTQEKALKDLQKKALQDLDKTQAQALKDLKKLTRPTDVSKKDWATSIADQKKALADAKKALVAEHKAALEELKQQQVAELIPVTQNISTLKTQDLGGFETQAFVEQYKQAVLTQVGAALDSGGQIIVNEPGHYTRLENVGEDGVVIDDPWKPGKNSHYSWEEANKVGYFRSFVVVKKK